MSAEDAGLLVTTVYAVTLIGAILGDALRTQRTKDERTMITKLRSLWHRLFPVRHPTPEEQARDDLQRQLRWRVDARLERAIRANRLPEDDARAVRREYKRLVAQRGSYGALAAAVDYAATLAPKEKGRASW